MGRRSGSETIGETAGETVGQVVDVEAVMETVEKDRLFYDESGGGVTFSGGEPLHQAPFLEALLAACNRREIHAALDTSGFAPGTVVDRLLPRLQLVLFDLKIMDDRQHRRHTGVSNDLIHGNLKRAAAAGTPVRIRVPLVPGITDGEANLASIIAFTRGLVGVAGVDLLPFHRIAAEKYRRLGLNDPMSEAARSDPQHLETIKNRFEAAGFDVSIGG
jgi:pyruvate formate lyase activating enzyme